jgi:hypothetical protein
MRIESLKYYIQSANINFLYGSGISRPYLPTLGNVENWLTDLFERRLDGLVKKTPFIVVKASIIKRYFETVMLPNVSPKGTAYDKTIAEYRAFLSIWNDLMNKRNNRLVNKQVNLFTTNVDTLVERAALGHGVEINDGFQGSLEQLFDAGNFQKTISKTSLHFQNVSDIPVFNLMKIHGSINWREDDLLIKNDPRLSLVQLVETQLKKIDPSLFIDTIKTSASGGIVDKTMDELIAAASGLGVSDVDIYKPFLEQYSKLIMINPTKRKFRESVIDHHFYELMRQFSNNLEKENTLLFVMGFSFADEHLADITRRAANTNPTLHVIIFAYDDGQKDVISNNLNTSSVVPNNNITIITPSSIKASNQDEKNKRLVDGISVFDLCSINLLFEHIAKSIDIHYDK